MGISNIAPHDLKMQTVNKKIVKASMLKHLERIL